ncbi:MAG: undecaprenyldiphospho-muramoylpentapeptide beta-N-acetylglucosaminyltransferase [Thermoanaerobaculales bacterium]|jgi:UDP-N-acetylglucosamine--N-acetylmuramyl-(pentapeptide) pyrophosphoryl-undecaprenol N-acetylglucosamine transferase|nr:undecaprenyldiphospho-muramoylpentapeptide beta-N-acetylglucosaminyltransferase [Thermoanaerobaculales bacterium]
MSRRVVIAGGGTGGHVFPGLAVASELQARGVEVHWLGARRGLEAELVPERKLPLVLVDLEGLKARGPAAAVGALALLPRAVVTSVRTMLRLDPLAVVGVGGYASAAGLVAAGLLGLPTVLQEQNSVPGLTNRFLAPWSDLICCGFSDALAHFPSLPAEWTGNPVRQRFFDITPVAPHEPLRLLVLGGSQGSLFLNRMLPRALAILAGEGQVFTVKHQTGGRWAEVVKTSYADLGVEAEVSAFLAEPWRSLAETDLVVARAGALTVSELAAAGRGALLVPFAAAAGNHQEFNARSIERAGGAVVLTEDEASPERLAEVLGRIAGDPGTVRRMGEAAAGMARPDAARRIADRVIAIGGGL